MPGDDQAGHAVAGVSLDVFGGHIDRSPAGLFQRAGVPAHLGDPHTVAVSGLLFLTWVRKPARAGSEV